MYIAFIGGSIFGCLITLLILYWHRNRQKISGVIFVDEKSNLCKFNILSNDLANKQTKEAIFLVAHETDLSREEHSL